MMFRATKALLLILFSFPAWAATPITAGTDLSTVLNSSGEYELQAGTHTVSTGFTMATSVTLTCVPEASILLSSSVILKFDDNNIISGCNWRMSNDSRLQAEAVSGNTFVQNAIIENNVFSTSGTITTAPTLRFGQGFNSYHRNNIVMNNSFFSVVVLEEVGDNIDYIGNQWFGMDNLRPLQWWGSNHDILRNYVNGGIFGLSALGKHNIAANRRPCTNNNVSSNIVLNTSEEGISFDVVGNVAAETVLREYDTVASKPGGDVINLTSANWIAQTTYTGSLYDAVFTSGTLAGQRFKITTHLGAAFTLSGLSSVYASVTVGDGVSIQLSCYGNTIANNIVIPKLTSTRAHTSGIALHGTGVDTNIINNIVYGENDGVGAGESGYTYFAIREASLNSITATDSITGNARRGPVGLNQVIGNRNLGGGIGSDYKNYGGSPDYTPPPSTYSDNLTISSSSIFWVGGDAPTTAEGFKLKPLSPLLGEGSPLGAKYDYESKRCGNPSTIGPFCSIAQDSRSSYIPRTTY